MPKSILYIDRFFPVPANTGGKKVSLSVIKTLTKEYVIDLVGFKELSTTQEHVNTLKRQYPQLRDIFLHRFERAHIWMLPFFNLTGRSYYFTRDRYNEMLKTLFKLINVRNYRVVFFNEIFSGTLLFNEPFFKHLKNKKLKSVLFLHNIEYMLFSRFVKNNFLLSVFLGPEKLLLRKTEISIWEKADFLIFISETDYKIACSFVPSIKNKAIHYFPIELFKQIPPSKTIPFEKKEPLILHIGTGHWPPNIEGLNFFLRKVFPLIKRKVPNAIFVHIGKGTPCKIKKFHNNVDIFIYDYIENLTPFYKKATLFVAPLLSGSGIKIKILEAISNGLPVVTTPIGIEGIPIREDIKGIKGIISVNKPAEMADWIVKLITNKAEWQKQAKSAQDLAKYIQTHFSNEHFLEAIRNLAYDQ